MGIFKFSLMEKVEIIASGETGLVVGRADYTGSMPQYLVQYRQATGCAVEEWWRESALVSVDDGAFVNS